MKIELKRVTKKFGELEVLKQINMKVKEGERFGIFGPSGCGKTTILRIIAGLEIPDSGEVYLDGKVVSSRKIFIPPERRNVSLVFQDLAIWPHMSVKEHLEFVLSDYNLNEHEVRNRIKEILKSVGLDGYENRKPNSLSGGEKQRLALARALVKKADILLLDEPLTSLDLRTKKVIGNLLLKLHETYGLTIVYVTHDIFEIVGLCDRVAVMENGKLLRIERVSQFFKKMKKQINL